MFSKFIEKVAICIKQKKAVDLYDGILKKILVIFSLLKKQYVHCTCTITFMLLPKLNISMPP